MNVTLRERTLPSGKVQLYLDYYGKGKRRRKSLKMVLTGDRARDKEIRKLAKAICAKKELELMNEEHGFSQSFKKEASFIEFIERIRDRKRGNIGVWKSTLYHVKNYTEGKPVTFRDITPEWLESYKFYLQNIVSPNTARGYYATVREALKSAVKEGIIPNDPSDQVKNIRGRDTYRAYLTFDEMQILSKTACADPEVKRAFLWTCYTGLRLGDVRVLTWKQVQGDELEVVQGKTKEPVYISLAPIARRIMGAPSKNDERVFSIPSDTHLSTIMKTWVAQAGITKKVTFHCARHTFATLMLSSGTDIYTVSKMLGHSRLETTQVYAKIIDQKKTDAVNNLPEIEVD